MFFQSGLFNYVAKQKSIIKNEIGTLSGFMLDQKVIY